MKPAICDFQVVQVANGWMLRELPATQASYTPPSRTWVFSSVPAMSSWIVQNLKEPSNDAKI